MTMGSWRETTLGEVCDEVGGIIQTGPFGSQLHQSDYSDVGIPVVMPKDIIEGRVAPDTVARVSSEHVERLSRHKLLSGDIVYGRRGDIGRQALIRPDQAGWMCGTGCLRLSLGASVLDPLFLHYYLRQDDVVGWITNQAVGATMPNLNTGILRSVPVRFPPLPVQQRIAGILSAYDELIENNQRRIKILESMARTLYREWFVHFRFPGHESVPRVPSPLGEIPQGWEVKTVEEIVKRIPVGKKYDQKTVSPTGAVPVFDQGKSGIIGYHDDEPGIVASEIAPVIVFANHTCYQRLVHIPFSVIQNVLPFVSTPALSRDIYWLHWATNGLVVFNDYKGHWPEFASKMLIVPPAALCQRFGEFAATLSLQNLKLERQIQNLRRTRDLLLPRLLSGQVNIETLREGVLS
ncbi:MAG: restriction endonuclease subunit S [Salinivirgaceae bacterium]|jgi:type I restriction enzyme S subunit|nr:restriction endonuclease subunit S [Salinivirgaceae bacterium]